MSYKYKTNGKKGKENQSPKQRKKKNNDSVELDFSVEDSNGDLINISGYATPLDDRIKLTLYFGGVCVKGVAIRFYEGDPFMCYPSFKNKDGEFVNLFYIADSTLRDNLISAVLGAC